MPVVPEEMKTEKTVLVITNDFPFCGIFPSAYKRMIGYYRYLPRYGWRVIVLSRICCCSIGREEAYQGIVLQGGSDWRESLEAYLIRNQEQSRLFIGFRAGMTSLAARQMRLQVKSGAVQPSPDHSVFWCPRLRSAGSSRPQGSSCLLTAARKSLSFLMLVGRPYLDWQKEGSEIGRALCRRAKVDVVLSSSPMLSNHILGREIQSKCRVPWVCEFRDSVRRNVQWWEPSPLWQWRYAFLRKNAAAVHVTRKEALADSWLRLRKSYIVENGFLEEETFRALEKAQRSKDVFILRYLGSMYAGKISLLMFLEGLGKLIAAQKIPSGKIRFEYYGNSAGLVRHEVASSRLQDYCRIHGMVGPDEALALAAASHVLVLPSTLLADDVPGAKLYEYLALKRPILATRRQGGYIEKLLDETGTGKVASTPEAVSRILGGWFHEFEESGEIIMAFNDAKIAGFSRASGAERMAGILDQILRK